MARYLVTGATGFLGRHLVSTLLESGHEVVALCRSDEAELAALGVRVVRGDVRDETSVKAAAIDCDGLFHAAGRVSRRREDAAQLYDLHVRGTRTALRAAHESGVRRVVYVSTSGTVAVSDDPDHIATEDDATPIGIIQRWPYYRSKLFAEQTALEVAQDREGFEVISVNPTLLLGPGDVRGSSTGDVVRLLEGRVPAIPPGGLSYVDVRDVATVLQSAMERGRPGRRYLVGACNVTLREFFARLSRLSGASMPAITLPRVPGLSRMVSIIAGRAGELINDEALDPISLEMAHFYWYLDATRAQNELGFRPRDPIDTLADTIEDLERRGTVAPRAERDARGSEAPSAIRRGRDAVGRLIERFRGQ